MIKFKLRRGFTLVELLISMLLASIVSIVLYSLFDTTSESLGEVTNLSDAQERVRFGMERLRADIKTAGSLSTPDSQADVWQRPKRAGTRIIGVSAYDGWQDDRTAFPTDVATANPNVSLDGFILMAAMDYPTSFEVRDLRSDADTDAQIGAHIRGLYKLYQVDPFKFSADAPPGFTDSAFLENQWGTRLLRLMDRQGYIQFVSLGDTITYTGGAAPYAAISLDAAMKPVFKAPGEEYGLEQNPEGDFAYDAAVVDAYWYHVEADPSDPTNMRLVRERLCAPEVAAGLNAAGGFDPSTAPASNCPGGTDEITVLVDHVADFQIWFDCTNNAATNGAVVGNGAWTDEWLTPDNSTNCMNTGVYAPQLARVAHVRLSIYAPNERKDLRNFQFENRAGETGATALTNTPNVKLRTFDPVPTLTGASPVVTMQSSIELTNYAYRNPLVASP